MKQQIQANPRARPFRLRVQGRADIDDEVFEQVGTLDNMFVVIAERLEHSRGRRKRNVIKGQQVIAILNGANFDTDVGLIDVVHLLGLPMQGFAEVLRVPNEEEDENETSEEE